MTGGENVYKYITTEGKVAGKKTGKITALEYLQKSTGVFNGNGLLSEEKVAEMKERLKNNKGNIWHGFVSLNKEQSYKIDTPEKCIGMIKATFGQFFQDAKLYGQYDNGEDLYAERFTVTKSSEQRADGQLLLFRYARRHYNERRVRQG